MEGRITHDEIKACIGLLEERVILPDLVSRGSGYLARWVKPIAHRVKPIAPKYRPGLIFILNGSIQQRLEAISPQRHLRRTNGHSRTIRGNHVILGVRTEQYGSE